MPASCMKLARPTRDDVHDVEGVERDAQVEEGQAIEFAVERNRPARGGTPEHQQSREDHSQRPSRYRVIDREDLEAVAPEQPLERRAREVVEMGRRMDHAPAASLNAGERAFDIAGRDRHEPAGLDHARDLGDDATGLGQVLDRVPEAVYVEPVADTIVEEIGLHRVHAERLPRVPDGVLRDVDTADTSKLVARKLQEKTVGAADLEQRFRARLGEMAHQRPQPGPEVVLKAGALRYVVGILAAVKVVPSVQGLELADGQDEVGRDESAGPAAQ